MAFPCRSKCIAPRPSHHIRIGVAQYIYLVLLTKLIQVIQFILRHVRNKSFPPIFHVLISQFFPTDFTQLTAKSLSIYVSIFYFLKIPCWWYFPNKLSASLTPIRSNAFTACSRSRLMTTPPKSNTIFLICFIIFLFIRRKGRHLIVNGK